MLLGMNNDKIDAELKMQQVAIQSPLKVRDFSVLRIQDSERAPKLSRQRRNTIVFVYISKPQPLSVFRAALKTSVALSVIMPYKTDGCPASLF